MRSVRILAMLVLMVCSSGAIAQIDLRRYEYLVYSRNEISDLYRNVGYKPIWISRNSVTELVDAVGAAETEGLLSSGYHYDILLNILNGDVDPMLADVILSDAYLTYGKHLRSGCVDPSRLFPGDWDPSVKYYDIVLSLLQALKDGNVAGSLDALKPTDPLYCKLRDELKSLKKNSSDSIAGYRSKILVNLEKCRWLSDVTLKRYIVVNIPSYEMKLFDGGECAINMRTIVGRPERKTPVMNSNINSLIINPVWTVPPTILKEDMLPAIQRNREYLQNNSLRLIDHNGIEIRPDSLPWSSYSAANFPFIIRQDAGIRNALGLIKFQFPNRHGIYMHDTNMHSLFLRTNRAFSSGCIRIERPFALASYLLKGTVWDDASLQDLVNKGESRTIVLDKQVQIQTTYFTLILSDDGSLTDVKDIYGWDTRIASHLMIQDGSPSGNLRQDKK